MSEERERILERLREILQSRTGVELLIAEELASLVGEEVADRLKEKPFVETPKPLAYYYKPHQYETVPAGEHVVIYSFNVPPEHVLHIEQVANNWFEDTYIEWEVDRVLMEKIERFLASINSPVDIRHRYIIAKDKVQWTAYNNSTEDIISEVVCDGTIYHINDWKRMLGKF